MEVIINYVDLCRKIDSIETQLEQVEIALFGKKFQGTDTDDFGVLGNMNINQIYYDKKCRLENLLEFHQDIKKESEAKINQLQGLNYQITRMKYMENKSYKQIADELGKSYGYIQSVPTRFLKETQGS